MVLAILWSWKEIRKYNLFSFADSYCLNIWTLVHIWTKNIHQTDFGILHCICFTAILNSGLVSYNWSLGISKTKYLMSKVLLKLWPHISMSIKCSYASVLKIEKEKKHEVNVKDLAQDEFPW